MTLSSLNAACVIGGSLFSWVAALLFLSAAQGGQSASLGFEVPPGFEVSLYADDALATDIFSLTIDAKGRVVVASKNYVKILHDTDGDGKADKATVFANMPKSGAHGMYFDGNDLVVVGDQGVRRLYDTDGDGVCDRISEPWFPTKNDGEHAANGIVKGPDGWYYLITGNDAGIGTLHAQAPGSPVKHPNAGCLVRFSPDGKTREVVAHGFRNPYDLAFNHLGHVFTVDADGERVHQMPYYTPTRLFDIAQGMHHGWILPGWAGSWSRPPYWPDVTERLVEIGRGSPTGVIVYRHRAFPERYRNGVFSLCWTFGRVYFFPLARKDSTYSSKMEVFMRTTGDVGFAPTDMAVGPDGDLFIAIGGRGTRGSVFRVRYKEPLHVGPAVDQLHEVLAANEPLSSWSRARWVPVAKKLGKDAFARAVLDGKLSLEARLRAVEVLTELFDGVPADVAETICGSGNDPELAARVVWSLARTAACRFASGQEQSSPAVAKLIVKMTAAADPRVARAAWEALIAWPLESKEDFRDLKWSNGLGSPDRRVRAAAIAAARGAGRTSFEAFRQQKVPRTAREQLALLWFSAGASSQAAQLESFWNTCLDLVVNSADSNVRLEAVRLLQIALGDVEIFEGPTKAFFGFTVKDVERVRAELRQTAAQSLAKVFPTNERHLDMEIGRLFAMMGADVPGLPEKIASRWQGKSSSADDIHYLLVVARIPTKRSTEATRQTAAALNGIQVKLAAVGARPTDQVPGILEAVLERLLSHDPALAQAIVDDPAFGLPGHALYANRLPLTQKQGAARKLLAGMAKLDEEEARAAWGPELVSLVAALPDAEAMPILRRQYSDPRLTDSIALYLAGKRQGEDRERLLTALSSTQPSVVAAVAQALVALTEKGTAATALDVGKAVRTLRRLDGQKANAAALKDVGQLLALWTKDAKEKTSSAWVEWYLKTYPKEAASLPGLASADFATWKKRLDKVNWDAGDVKRGEVVFQKKNCYRCHGEQRRLGPDLSGAAQRFSRDDLFTAILDPNKDIAPAYRATAIVTKSGKIYTGMLIYDSPALTLLQTTPDTTVRISSEELQLVQPSNVSFMPTGLLDDLRDEELADLYAYLKTIRKK